MRRKKLGSTDADGSQPRTTATIGREPWTLLPTGSVVPPRIKHTAPSTFFFFRVFYATQTWDELDLPPELHEYKRGAPTQISPECGARSKSRSPTVLGHAKKTTGSWLVPRQVVQTFRYNETLRLPWAKLLWQTASIWSEALNPAGETPERGRLRFLDHGQPPSQVDGPPTFLNQPRQGGCTLVETVAPKGSYSSTRWGTWRWETFKPTTASTTVFTP